MRFLCTQVYKQFITNKEKAPTQQKIKTTCSDKPTPQIQAPYLTFSINEM